MEYLKFNCHDLAAQSDALYEAHNKLISLNGELSDILNTLDPQIKSYEGFKNQFSSIKATASDLDCRLLAAADSLDQIVDVYYSAESRAMQASEALPVRMAQKESKTNVISLPPTVTASIHSNDLVLEDWLAELVYQYGKDENNG